MDTCDGAEVRPPGPRTDTRQFHGQTPWEGPRRPPVWLLPGLPCAVCPQAAARLRPFPTTDRSHVGPPSLSSRPTEGGCGTRACPVLGREGGLAGDTETRGRALGSERQVHSACRTEHGVVAFPGMLRTSRKGQPWVTALRSRTSRGSRGPRASPRLPGAGAAERQRPDSSGYPAPLFSCVCCGTTGKFPIAQRPRRRITNTKNKDTPARSAAPWSSGPRLGSDAAPGTPRGRSN